MKFSALIVLVSASMAMASPAAVSLERSTKEVRDAANNIMQLPCIECPCEGWEQRCQCVTNGCCCN